MEPRQLIAMAFLTLSVLTAHSETSLAPLHVQPEFRQTPIWYWQSSEKKCVPVPAVDVISRVAPARIREAHFKNTNPRCEINVDNRQIKAELTCSGQLLTEYFSSEQLCKANLGTKQASLH